MPPFLVADLDPQGELKLQAEYRYEELELIPGASELIAVISGLLWQAQGDFDAPLDAKLALRLAMPSPTTAIASLRQSKNEKLLSLSLLLTGINADADQLTINALQTHLLRELHGTPFEPAFGLLQISARPLIASIHLALPEESTVHHNFALADRCLGAAYFRYHRLA